MDRPSKLGELGESLTAFFTRRKKAGPLSVAKLTGPKHSGHGRFQFEFQLDRGAHYRVEASADLKIWNELSTGDAVEDTTEFVDAGAGKFGARFYRVVAQGAALSENVVGYVNVSYPPGFSMIANPLNAESNRVDAILPSLPEGATLSKFDTSLFRLTKNAFKEGKWSNPGETLSPGEGALISNPTSDFRTLTFVGEVRHRDLSLPIPPGFSIRSSLAPLPGALDTALQFPALDGDVVHLFDRDRQEYVIHTFRNGGWSPSTPMLGAGESFWIGKTAAGNWAQTGLIDAAFKLTE